MGASFDSTGSYSAGLYVMFGFAVAAMLLIFRPAPALEIQASRPGPAGAKPHGQRSQSV